jgi:N-methylhydantoinase A/oxoprolinase/acetone carboxylase beta subunit
MYKIAIDIGGTFTDVAVLMDDRVEMAKSPTTPGNPAVGVISALEVAAGEIQIPLEELLRNTTHFVHGTTIGTNALIERTGATTGLITSKGHEDTLAMGRIFSKRAGLDEREIIHVSRLNKPHPLVPRELVKGVAERVDYAGDMVVPLNEGEVIRAIDELLAAGVEAIAVCYLWSFVNSVHEARTKELIRERAPGVFVTVSSDISQRLGEYERTVTTVLNCYLGPKVKEYLSHLKSDAARLGYQQPLLVMQSGGGVVPAETAMDSVVSTIDSGPAGGILGSQYFGAAIGEDNLICTDVGGTSFDVGIVYGGKLQLENQPVVSQYVYNAPKILVKSIGAGGGSIAWRDALGYLHVGPRSAGAQPGPACYDRGGTEPTLTDADLILGFLNPDFFLGGRQKLRMDLARQALEPLAVTMDMDVTKLAWGIVQIANAQMADLVRRTTIEQGYDPREFAIVAYGGAGPMHAVFYAADIGSKYLLVPHEASVFSAFGMSSADIVHRFDASHPMLSPLPAHAFEQMNDTYRTLTERLLATFAAEGFPQEKVTIRRSAFMRYQAQVHELEVELPVQEYSPEDEAAIGRMFSERYASVFGKGAGFEAAGFEILTFRVTGSADPGKPQIEPSRSVAATDAANAVKGTRPVFFGEGFVETTTYAGNKLETGHRVAGPAIIERMGDTIVIPLNYEAIVDPYGNIRIEQATTEKGEAEWTTLKQRQMLTQ